MLWLKHPKKNVLRELALFTADTIVLPLHSRDGIDVFFYYLEAVQFSKTSFDLNYSVCRKIVAYCFGA